MLTRRSFGGIVSCAICAVTGFAATEVAAQGTSGAPPAATPGVKRKVLSQVEGPSAGYVTLIVEIEIEPNMVVARHTHPGIESGYIVDGEIELPIEGQPTKVYKTGEAFQVPPNTPHAGGAKNGPKPVKVVSTYIVEKGKPLATPA